MAIRDATRRRPGRAKGKIRMAPDFDRVLIAPDDFTELPMTLAHADALATLAPHHADPFDRALIAQATVERAIIVSHDRALEPNDVPMIWT